MSRFLTYLIALLTCSLLSALFYTVFSLVYSDIPINYHFNKKTTNETLNYSLERGKNELVTSKNKNLLFGSSMALNNFLLEKVEESVESSFYCIGGWGIPPSSIAMVLEKLPIQPEKIFIPISLNECNRANHGVRDKSVTSTSPILEALDPKSLKRTLKYCNKSALHRNDVFQSLLFNESGNIPLARFRDGFKKDSRRFTFQYNPDVSICFQEMELVTNITQDLGIEVFFLFLPFRTQGTEHHDFQRELSELQQNSRHPVIDLRAANIPTEHWLDKTHLDSTGARLLSEHFSHELLKQTEDKHD